jgi:hypothetical protein
MGDDKRIQVLCELSRLPFFHDSGTWCLLHSVEFSCSERFITSDIGARHKDFVDWNYISRLQMYDTTGYKTIDNDRSRFDEACDLNIALFLLRIKFRKCWFCLQSITAVTNTSIMMATTIAQPSAQSISGGTAGSRSAPNVS